MNLDLYQEASHAVCDFVVGKKRVKVPLVLQKTPRVVKKTPPKVVVLSVRMSNVSDIYT